MILEISYKNGKIDRLPLSKRGEQMLKMTEDDPVKGPNGLDFIVFQTSDGDLTEIRKKDILKITKIEQSH